MTTSLSTILSAIRPRERSDQYAVLGALYSLNAQSSPITAKEVTKALKLHLGGKTPNNVNTRLRTYAAYVEPVEGPPLRWRLKAEGIGKSVLLLKGIAAYLGTGVARVTYEQLKEASLHYDAYDASNFAAYLKSLSAEVSGTKEGGFTLTARGLTSGTELVKNLMKAPS